MQVLAFDPGKNQTSFAFARLVDGHIKQYGLVRPITTMRHPQFSMDADDFHLRIQNLVRGFGLTDSDAIVAERFLDRGGGGKGTTGEHICSMLGIMKAAIQPLPLQLVEPATWKGWLARTYLTGKETKRQHTVVPNMWQHLRLRFPDQCWPKDKALRMVIHEADAIGIALWRYENTPHQPNRVGTITHLIGDETVKTVV